MGVRIVIEGARLSYPHLFQARAITPGDTPKFGTALLVPKTHPAIAQIMAAEVAEKGNKWGANIPPAYKGMPMYDGDTDPKYNTDPQNHGMMIINTGSTEKPHTVDQNAQPIMDASMMYAGCFVNADFNVYAYDQPMSKGCAFGLNGVQFVADGERIDGRMSAQEMFGPVAGAPAPIAPGVAPIPAAAVPQGQPVTGQVPPGQPAAYAPPAQAGAAPQAQQGYAPAAPVQPAYQPAAPVQGQPVPAPYNPAAPVQAPVNTAVAPAQPGVAPATVPQQYAQQPGIAPTPAPAAQPGQVYQQDPNLFG